MKSSAFILPAVLCAAVAAWPQGAQTPLSPPPSSSQPSSAPSAGQLKVRGPEAVAQQDPNRVVATVAGKPITAKQAVELLKPLRPEDRKRFESNLSGLLQQIYMENELAGEATKMNLDQQSPWKEQLQITRVNILTQAYIAKMSSNASGAADDPKKYYDDHAADFEQLKLSGILVAFNPPGTPASGTTIQRTEAQALEKANDLEKKIKAGGDFSALARTDSDHQQSSTRGGDLGTVVLADQNLTPDIKSAISKLQDGQVSEPVKVPGGYYIFKLVSRSKIPFEQARAGIVQKIQNERSQIIIKQELDKYKVQVQDQDFFSASGAPGANIPSLQRPAPATAPPASSKP
jgi:peptidyl-prolyl cis-trans isomerase C